MRFTNRYSNGKAFIMNCALQTTNGIEDAIEKLAEYEDLEEQGRLIKLSIRDIHPCRNCDVGWGSISSEGSDGCENYCTRLKEYNKKYNI